MVLAGSVVLAVRTFALLRITRDSALVALAVILLTLRCLALAPLEVLALVFNDLVFEGFDVPLEDIFDRLPPSIGVLIVIMAFRPRSSFTLTVRPASSFVPEALTVQFEALRTLTFATHAGHSRLLALNLLEELILRDGLIHDLLGHLADVLFVPPVLDLFLLVGEPERILVRLL